MRGRLGERTGGLSGPQLHKRRVRIDCCYSLPLWRAGLSGRGGPKKKKRPQQQGSEAN